MLYAVLTLLTKLIMRSKLDCPTELDESRMKKISAVCSSHGFSAGQVHTNEPFVLMQLCEQPPLLTAHSSMSGKTMQTCRPLQEQIGKAKSGAHWESIIRSPLGKYNQEPIGKV